MGGDLDYVSANSSSVNAEERKPLERKLKLLTATAIFRGNIAFGMGLNTYGPALTSLQNKFGTDDASISKVFTIMTGSYMIGALCGGYIYNHVNRQLAVIFLLLTQAIMMILTPHCPTMTIFFVTAAVMGLCSGSYDTAQFVWMMEMMQKDCPPYVQTQHFFYALGTSFVSLIMAPFLDPDDPAVTTPTSLTSTTPVYINDKDYYMVMNSSSNAEGGIFADADPDDEVKHGERLFIPYTIVGCLILLTMVMHILLFTFLRYRPPPPETSEDFSEVLQPNPENEVGSEAARSPLVGEWSLPKLRIVVLACIFYGAYSGMEMTTIQFFPKFGQNSALDLSEAMSSYVLSGLTTAFAIGRAIAIIIVFKVSTQLILCGNIIIILIANIVLISWAESSITALWASGILFGLGFSSSYGSFSAYIERYLNFTNSIGSMMIVSGSGVAALYPVVIGNYIELNPIVLSYTAFFSIAFLIISFSSLSYLTHRNKTRY